VTTHFCLFTSATQPPPFLPSLRGPGQQHFRSVSAGWEGWEGAGNSTEQVSCWELAAADGKFIWFAKTTRWLKIS